MTGKGQSSYWVSLLLLLKRKLIKFLIIYLQYGLEEEQRNRLLRTYIRNAFSFHLNEIFSAVRNEYTDWDKPVQHPINIRYFCFYIKNRSIYKKKGKISKNFPQNTLSTYIPKYNISKI